MIGDVAALGDELAWLDPAPAARALGRRHPGAGAGLELAARLRELGATVVEAPAIRTEPLDAELPDPRSFDLVCVTSPTGAQRLLEGSATRGRSPAR